LGGLLWGGLLWGGLLSGGLLSGCAGVGPPSLRSFFASWR